MGHHEQEDVSLRASFHQVGLCHLHNTAAIRNLSSRLCRGGPALTHSRGSRGFWGQTAPRSPSRGTGEPQSERLSLAPCAPAWRQQHLALRAASEMAEQGQRWAGRTTRTAAHPKVCHEITGNAGVPPHPFLHAAGTWGCDSTAAFITCHQGDKTRPSCTKGHQQALTTLWGSLCPGRYLTFSCSVFMISVSRRPPTSSSSTHMFTVFSKVPSRAALLPTILAMAEPLCGRGGGGGEGKEPWAGGTGAAGTGGIPKHRE